MNYKDEMLQWIVQLEEYAKTQGLSMRILDSIGDCREHIMRDDLSWHELSQQIEEILESIWLKVQPQDTSIQPQGKNQVSIKKVQEKVREMAADCHRDNLDTVSAIGIRKDQNIREAVRKMGEITYTEAHLDELLDIRQYADFFHKIRDAYEKDMVKTASEMVSGISSNYDHMSDHMKNMFHNIGGYADGIGNEKFYREYESAKTDMENRLVSDIHSVEMGGSFITEFADRTKEKLQSIIRKILLKKRLLIAAPIILIFVLFVGKTVISLRMAKAALESAKQSAEDGSIDFNAIINLFGGLVSEKSENMDPSMELISSSWVIAIVLIIITAYVLYVKKLKKWCDHRICEDCGVYLRTEVAAFEKENQLTRKADEAIAQVVADCEQQYLIILNRVFAGTKYEERETGEASGFANLQERWNQLKYN